MNPYLEDVGIRALHNAVWHSHDGTLQTNEFHDTLLKAAQVGALEAAEGLGLDVEFDEVFDKTIKVRIDDVLGDLTATNRKVMAKTVREAVDGGLSRPAMINKIKRVIGLDERYANAVDNYEETLLNKGHSAAQASRMSKAYADRLLTHRATTIARTEINYALNAGQQLAWEQAEQKGLIDDDVKKAWSSASGCCSLCDDFNGDLVSLHGTFPNGVEHPPAHPHCRCSMSLVYPKLSKAVISKYNKNHAADSGKFASGRGTASGSAGLLAGGGEHDGPYGTVTRVPAKDYQTNKAGRTLQDEMKISNIHSPISALSQMVNPLTGHRMTKTEVGKTFEAMLINLKNKPAIVKNLGTGMTHVATHHAHSSAKGYRQDPIDVKTKRFALEVKALNAHAGDPNITINRSALRNKRAEATRMKLKPAVVAMVWDGRAGTVSIHVHKGDYSRTGDIDKPGKFRPRQMQHVATFKVSKAEFEKAQADAGYLRNKKGKIISPVKKAHTDGFTEVDPPKPTSKSRSKGKYGLGKDQDGNDITPDDVTISLTKDGVLVIKKSWEEIAKANVHHDTHGLFTFGTAGTGGAAIRASSNADNEGADSRSIMPGEPGGSTADGAAMKSRVVAGISDELVKDPEFTAFADKMIAQDKLNMNQQFGDKQVLTIAQQTHIDEMTSYDMMGRVGIQQSYERAMKIHPIRDENDNIVPQPYPGHHKAIAHLTAQNMVDGWAQDACDSDPRAIAYQLSAASVHGGAFKPGAGYTNAKSVSQGNSIYKSTKPLLDSATRAEYAVTQRTLASKGITEVYLQRGVALKAGTKSGTFKVETNPLSSWATHESVAKDFASGDRNKDAFHLTAVVPAKRIQSLAITGRGCLSEKEAVVIGAGGFKVKAKNLTPSRTRAVPQFQVGAHVPAVKGTFVMVGGKKKYLPAKKLAPKKATSMAALKKKGKKKVSNLSKWNPTTQQYEYKGYDY